jgi:hypothetical protein
VVLLHRLLLGQVELLTLMNAIRFTLLVGFPLAVYWSMRRMAFSTVAAAVGAASASLLSANGRYGFEYGSYVWLGFGMFTQLWAMSLSFVTLACLDRLVTSGKGYVAAVMSFTLLVLVHLIYAYMMAITALLLVLVGLTRSDAGRRIARLAIVGALVAVATAYMSLPFVLERLYLSASPYLQRWKYDSYGARDILTALVNGDLLDFGRLPVLTALLALGLAAALCTRSRPARLSLVLFTAWLLLYFGRPTWGRLLDVLPLHEGVLMHRFAGSVHLAAILVIGLGGEWIARRLPTLDGRRRVLVLVLVVLALLVPAFLERRAYYARNAQGMERNRQALTGDTDAAAILATLRALPPGRTHAGLRANWGSSLRMVDLHFYDLLPFHRLPAVSPPYSSVSLNADLIWHFDDRDAAHYELFNVRYLVAPRAWVAPGFLRVIKETSRYVLYETPARGYAELVTLAGRVTASTQPILFRQNLDWFQHGGSAAGRYVRRDFPARSGAADAAGVGKPAAGEPAGCPERGVTDERVEAARITLVTECPAASTLVLKLTYHPNWRVTVDGAEVETFMVSPSFLGAAMPAGRHEVRAEYRSTRYRMALLGIALVTLAAVAIAGRRLERLVG